MSAPLPPPDVLAEFLFAVSRLAREWDEGFVPVLRGSLLLRHWYGNRARPAADIDIECFNRPGVVREVDPEEEPDQPEEGFYDLEVEPYQPEREFYGPVEGRFGQWGNFVSRIDLGKAMCRYGAGAAGYRRPGGDVGIRFGDEESPPADGASLWVYGTPGRRYYATWEWPEHAPDAGRLQIDFSTPGDYTPADLGVTDETFVAPGNVPFAVAAYSREAMLATKVSWLVRGFQRTESGRSEWAGEPKDLFDAHLLAGDPGLRPDVFRRAMLHIGAADGLDWTALDNLFDVRRRAVTDEEFANWPAFASRHRDHVSAGPAALWADLAARLEPLLGDLYPAAEMPFLAAINARPGDELTLRVYADWLDDRDDPRGRVVRLIADRLFAGPDSPPDPDLAAALAGTSEPWLHQLFGSSARLRAFQSGPGIFF